MDGEQPTQGHGHPEPGAGKGFPDTSRFALSASRPGLVPRRTHSSRKGHSTSCCALSHGGARRGCTRGRRGASGISGAGEEEGKRLGSGLPQFTSGSGENFPFAAALGTPGPAHAAMGAGEGPTPRPHSACGQVGPAAR